MLKFNYNLFQHSLVSKKQLIVVLLAGDLIILVFHLLFNQYQFFHFDFEQNLPTYYQSFKLIFFGLFFLAISLKSFHNNITKFFMLPLAMFLFLLGLDELLQIHENIYRIFTFVDWFHPSKIVAASMKMGYRSSLWILYYLPLLLLFVFWSGYWMNYFQSRLNNNFSLFMLSFISFFTIIITEILSSTGTYSDAVYFLLVTIEETAEMLLATFLILVGVQLLKFTQDSLHETNN